MVWLCVIVIQVGRKSFVNLELAAATMTMVVVGWGTGKKSVQFYIYLLFLLILHTHSQAHISFYMTLSIISIARYQHSCRRRNFSILWIQFSTKHRSLNVKQSFSRWVFIQYMCMHVLPFLIYCKKKIPSFSLHLRKSMP